MKTEILNALKLLRQESRKRKFNQSVDLIINLKKFNIKKDSINLSISLPYKIRTGKVAAFLNQKSSLVETVTKKEFDKYNEKKEIKKFVKKYDYFIASAKLMPSIATTFGKYLGPAGKMPSPGFGIITSEDEATIKNEIDKFQGAQKIKTKEASIKLSVGNEEMKDEEIAENAATVYKAVLNALPRKKENIKNILLKFTMSKPKKINLK